MAQLFSFSLMESIMKYSSYFQTPIGILEVLASKEAILSILFVDHMGESFPNKVTKKAQQQLEEYFQGTRREFDLPLDAGGTKFQQSVWHKLTKIEYGTNCSYRDIANAIDNPKAVRAVGSANGKNPMTIVVPCHRVIGTNGSLTGYAFGVDKKAWLLKHENENYHSLLTVVPRPHR